MVAHALPSVVLHACSFLTYGIYNPKGIGHSTISFKNHAIFASFPFYSPPSQACPNQTNRESSLSPSTSGATRSIPSACKAQWKRKFHDFHLSSSTCWEFFQLAHSSLINLCCITVLQIRQFTRGCKTSFSQNILDSCWLYVIPRAMHHLASLNSSGECLREAVQPLVACSKFQNLLRWPYLKAAPWWCSYVEKLAALHSCKGR